MENKTFIYLQHKKYPLDDIQSWLFMINANYYRITGTLENARSQAFEIAQSYSTVYGIQPVTIHLIGKEKEH